MNKFITGLLVACSLSFAQLASASIIQGGVLNGTDVGNLDSLVAQTTGLSNSNPTTETNWVNSVLDPDTTFVIKEEKVTYYATDAANVFAFQLQAAPGYFLVKNARWWALFENAADADWGVVDFSQLSGGFHLPDLQSMTISHVSEFGEFPHIDVPEPSTILLVMLGLLGLGLARNRQKS